MRRVFLVLLLIMLAGSVYSSDNTDQLLDEAIEEFSNENYDEALTIIDQVLEEEPENSVAKMYKKTIEDVSNLNDIEQESNEIVKHSNNAIVSEEAASNEDEPEEEVKVTTPSILSLDTYLLSTSDSRFVIEERIKLYLGLPVIALSLKTDRIDYDFDTLSGEIFPFDEIDPGEKNSLDFSIGLRYHPTFFGDEPGFFDLKLGAVSYFNYSDLNSDQIVLPYIGFDTEVAVFSLFGDNSLFNGLWLGSTGSLYIYNGNVINNSTLGFKGGFKFSFFNIGFSYNVDSIESIGLESTTYGLILGVDF